MKIFTATLDTTARILTSIIFIVLVFTIYAVYNTRDSAPLIAMIFMIALFVIVFPACYALSVKHFIISDDKLIVRKHFGLSTEIRFTDISSTEILNKNEIGPSIRTFGSGGFWGYFGSYRNKQLGNFTLYATSMNNWVLLTRKNGKKVVVSPDDAVEFNQLVRQRLNNKSV